jgi:AbrB family looped-hinge helix DNA binding protein
MSAFTELLPAGRAVPPALPVAAVRGGWPSKTSVRQICTFLTVKHGNPQGTRMSTATLNSKGQITIPADVRRVLNLQAGDRVEFVQVEPGRFELVAATRSVRELKAMFGKPARTVSIEEMNRTIAEQGARAAGQPRRAK